MPHFLNAKTKKMKLPSHEECCAKIEAGEATPIDRFIHDWEPAGLEDSENFRKLLSEAIEHSQYPYRKKIINATPDEKRKVYVLNSIVYEEPEACTTHILVDLQESEGGDEFDYKVKIERMTQAQIDNLPETDY